MDAHPYDFTTVADRLSEAGMTLLALHVPGVRPAGYRGFWPAIPETVGDDGHAPPPSAAAISRMDEALGWIALLPDSKAVLRKLVGARALTSWRSGKPVFGWAVLGRMMGCTDKTAKAWWIEGVMLLVLALNRPGLCRQPHCLGTRRMAAEGLARAAAASGVAPRRERAM